MPEYLKNNLSENGQFRGRPQPCLTARAERLVASGKLKPATVDLAELGRPADLAHEFSISDALSQQRAES